MLPACDLVLGSTSGCVEYGFTDLAVYCKLVRDGMDGACADRISTDLICGTSGAISLLFGMDIVEYAR